jgi:hypothetical protein
MGPIDFMVGRFDELEHRASQYLVGFDSKDAQCRVVRIGDGPVLVHDPDWVVRFIEPIRQF